MNRNKMTIPSGQFWCKLLDQATAALSVFATVIVIESGVVLLCLSPWQYRISPVWGLLPVEASLALNCSLFASFCVGAMGLLLAVIHAIRGQAVPEANWLAARASIYACGAGGTLMFAASIAAR